MEPSAGRTRSQGRRAIVILAALAILAIVLALPRGRRDVGATPTSGFRVGLVFDVGGRGDKSFNDAAYIGLMRAARERGVAVEYVEPGGPEDREAALRLFAARGFDLVLGVGFIFSRDVDTVAADYPSTRFACVDYAPAFGPSGPIPAPPNVTGLAFRENEGSYLVGAVAGLTTTTRHVGFVGGMDIPLIHKFEAGYHAGVLAVCPTCEVHLAYAGSSPDAFRDPAKGKAIALSQIGAGADVLFHASGSTGHGVFEAARASGVLAIGVDSDQYDEAPGSVLTSMVKRADVAVFDAIVAALEGKLHPGMLVLGLAEGGLDWVHEGAHAALVSPAVRDRVEALRAAVVHGQVDVPVQ
jgi:basic membrane protein A